MAEVTFEFRLPDSDFADSVEEWLLEHHAIDVRRRMELGLADVLPIVIVASIAVQSIAGLAMWVRGRTRCQVLIDARGPRIHKQIDCRVRDGKLIIITRDGTRVKVYEAPPAIDLTPLITAALSGGGKEVGDAVQSIGVATRIVPGRQF